MLEHYIFTSQRFINHFVAPAKRIKSEYSLFTNQLLQLEDYHKVTWILSKSLERGSGDMIKEEEEGETEQGFQTVQRMSNQINS